MKILFWLNYFRFKKLNFLLCLGSQDGELDLTGSEDPVVLNAVIATLTPIIAYKEGSGNIFKKIFKLHIVHFIGELFIKFKR